VVDGEDDPAIEQKSFKSLKLEDDW
jgi:hypothetical protein